MEFFLTVQSSDECTSPHHRREPDESPSLEATISLLGRRPCVTDVGAQSLEEGTDDYPPLVALTPIDLEGFDPLE